MQPIPNPLSGFVHFGREIKHFDHAIAVTDIVARFDAPPQSPQLFGQQLVPSRIPGTPAAQVSSACCVDEQQAKPAEILTVDTSLFGRNEGQKFHRAILCLWKR